MEASRKPMDEIDEVLKKNREPRVKHAPKQGLSSRVPGFPAEGQGPAYEDHCFPPRREPRRSNPE